MNSLQHIGFVLILLIVALLTYVSGAVGALSFCLSLGLYASGAYLIVTLWRKFRMKNPPVFSSFFLNFLSSVGIMLSLIFGLIASYAYYQNDIAPATMPRYTLTNGEKILVFQGMSHIGTENFYKQVADTISKHKKEGFVLFYEGVRPGSEENTTRFNELLGVQFDADLYENFSKLYGLTHQDNTLFLGLENDKDYNIDLSLDTIVEIYNQRFPDATPPQREVLQASQEITKVLTSLNDRQLAILVYLNQAIISTIIKSEGLRESLLEVSGNANVFEVILEDRNMFLVDAIEQSDEEKIIVIYGLMHFRGVYEELKRRDPKWTIQKTDYLSPLH